MHTQTIMNYMVRKTVDVDDELWKEMEKKAVDKFGLRGAIKKAVNEAIREWLKQSQEG